MSMERISPVIGVFGGSANAKDETLDLADRLGYTIAERGWIILTGGAGPACEPVKNRAIQGALRHEGARWVGIDRTKRGTPTCSLSTGGIAIQSTLNHQRNYLEACMVDAAVCLEGGEGTLSELTCCLMLRRPTALVGKQWKTSLACDLEGDILRATSTLVRATEATLKKVGVHTFERHVISESAISRGLESTGPYAYFEPTDSMESIADWVKSKLPLNSPYSGYFPDVAGHANVKKDYLLWLLAIGAMRPSDG